MTPTFCFLLIHDGRHDYRERTLASAKEMLPEPDLMIEVDDTAHELGFAGAIAEGWRRVIAGPPVDYVFHCEGDFLFNSPVPIDRMIAVLERHPSLAQISLMRQPWGPAEEACGGFIGLNADSYRQRVDHGDIFTEHRVCFTTNPSLYPAALCRQGWPQEQHSEGIFTHRLLADPDVRFGIWGAKNDPPRVTHIGHERAGHGY